MKGKFSKKYYFSHALTHDKSFTYYGGFRLIFVQCNKKKKRRKIFLPSSLLPNF